MKRGWFALACTLTPIGCSTIAPLEPLAEVSTSAGGAAGASGGAGKSGASQAGSGGSARPTTRDAALWPFEERDPWNLPIGTGAAYDPVDSPAFKKDVATLNAGVFSQPVVLASDTDPLVSIDRPSTGTECVALHIPKTAVVSAEGFLNVIDPSRKKVVEFYPLDLAKRTSEDCFLHPLIGAGFTQGIRTYGGSTIGGLVRKGELERGVFHALAASVYGKALSNKGDGGKPWVWPATAADTGAATIYGSTGNLHIGTLLAIPQEIDLGVTGPAALIIGQAMKDYGVYIVGSIDEASNMAFIVEPAAAEEVTSDVPQWLPTLVSKLRVVSNNRPGTNAAGGGTPVQPYAPPFAP